MNLIENYFFETSFNVIIILNIKQQTVPSYIRSACNFETILIIIGILYEFSLKGIHNDMLKAKVVYILRSRRSLTVVAGMKKPNDHTERTKKSNVKKNKKIK